MITDDKRSRDLLLLAGCIICCEAAGVLGSFATAPAIPLWYASLVKPSFTPPNRVFAPVWTTLYALMGVSLFLVLKRGWNDPRLRKTLVLFGIHLLVNVGWSWLFFGLRSPAAGLAAILVLIMLIALVIYRFLRFSRLAAVLMGPYLLWVLYAAALNFSIWNLNR